MLKIHTEDGQTCHIDLSDERQARDFFARFASTSAQQTITGATLVQRTAGRFKCEKCRANGHFECDKCGRSGAGYEGQVQYSLARPEGFHQVQLHADAILADEETGVKGGERIVCQLDDVRLVMMVHRSQPSIRVSLAKTGKMRFNPQAR